jgi:hypothetical protein
LEKFDNFFVQFPNIEFYGNPLSGSRIVTCGQAGRGKLLSTLYSFHANSQPSVHAIRQEVIRGARQKYLDWPRAAQTEYNSAVRRYVPLS